jgi:hypothetical protein
MKKKTVTLRLGSVVANGLGGPEAGAMNLIYSKLLQDYGLNTYSYIGVNQICQDLEEIILKQPGGVVHINIRYNKASGIKFIDQLNIIHEALLRLSREERKLDANKLEEIYAHILSKEFKFRFICKEFFDKKRGMVAQLLVEPELSLFKYFIDIKGPSKACKIHIYSGGTDIFYLPAFFDKGAWVASNTFTLKGTKNETEIRINYDECSFDVINLTKYRMPPYFQMMRGDLTEEERRSAIKDWEHSLPPEIAAIVTQSLN